MGEVLVLRLRVLRWFLIASIFAPLFAVYEAIRGLVLCGLEELTDENHWSWRRMWWMFRHGKHCSVRSWQYDWKDREP